MPVLGYTDQELKPILDELNRGQVPQADKTKFKVPNSTPVLVLERETSPVLGQDGRMLGWMIVLRDETEEYEISQAREVITETLVHDLSSPMSAVIGALDLIEAEKVDDYGVKRLETIRNHIQQLVEAGFGFGDICILTRTNKSAVEIASFLLDNNIKVVSSESLLLTNSPDVRLMVAFFKLLLQPAEKVLLAEFIEQLLEAGKAKGTFPELFSKAYEEKGGFLKSVAVYFKEGSSLAGIIGRPVYDIAEFAVRNLLQTGRVNVFLQYFLDFV